MKIIINVIGVIFGLLNLLISVYLAQGFFLLERWDLFVATLVFSIIACFLLMSSVLSFKE